MFGEIYFIQLEINLIIAEHKHPCWVHKLKAEKAGRLWTARDHSSCCKVDEQYSDTRVWQLFSFTMERNEHWKNNYTTATQLCKLMSILWWKEVHGLVQNCGISSLFTLEIPQSCTKLLNRSRNIFRNLPVQFIHRLSYQRNQIAWFPDINILIIMIHYKQLNLINHNIILHKYTVCCHSIIFGK